jgi:signal transduction histidine kinase
MTYLKTACFVLFVCLSSFDVMGQVTASTHADINVSHDALLLEDINGTLSLPQVLNKPLASWVSNQGNELNLGYSTSVWWVRVEIDNTDLPEGKRIFEVDWPLLDWLDVYLLNGQSVLENWKMGDQRPVSERTFTVDLDLPADSKRTLLLRLALSDGVFDEIPLRLWSPDDFLRYQSISNLSAGLFFGAALGLLLFNSLLFLVLKERLFITYALFLFLFTLWSFGFSGYGLLYIWPAHPSWNNLTNLVLPGCTILASSLFVQEYLEAKVRLPNLYRILMVMNVFLLVPIAYSIADQLGVNGPTVFMFESFIVLSSAILILYLCMGAVLVYRGYYPARYLLCAWAMLALGVLIYQISALPDGPLDKSIFTENAINIGSTFQFAIMSMALADRFKRLRDESLAMERHTYELEVQYSSNLERQVKQRTEALEEMIVHVNGALESERLAMKQQREFLSTVSHELRTPVAIIDTIAQNLILTSGDQSDSLTKTRFDNIAKCTGRLTSVLDDFLDESRFELIHQKLNLTSCNPTQLLLDAAHAANVFAHGNDIRVDSDGLPERVVCDRDLMRLVLRTLADNAVKYTTPGTDICLQGGTNAKGTWFEISDKGNGLSKEDLGRLFEKGFRGQNAEGKPGTGYGLALAKNAIDKHGGTISASSELGHGTKFTIHLPFLHAETTM